MNFCKYDPRSLDRLSDHYGLVFVWKSMIGMTWLTKWQVDIMASGEKDLVPNFSSNKMKQNYIRIF